MSYISSYMYICIYLVSNMLVSFHFAIMYTGFMNLTLGVSDLSHHNVRDVQRNVENQDVQRKGGKTRLKPVRSSRVSLRGAYFGVAQLYLLAHNMQFLPFSTALL